MTPTSDPVSPGVASEAVLHRRRIVLLLLVLLAGVGLTTSDFLHDRVTRLVLQLGAWTVGHSALAGSGFVVFAALSAMLAFFSSAILVPVAIAVWGRLATLSLLWAGWFLGGAASYWIGRGAGGPLLRWLVPAERVARYRNRMRERPPLWAVLLLQLALPSEIPGYLLGALGYPFSRYVLVLALGELPFAVGTVLLGESFLVRSSLVFVAVGLAGAALVAVAGSALARHLRGG